MVLCPICGGIPESERREFLGGLGIKVRRYAKGETVARQGSVVRSLYILSKGSVGTRMMFGDGTTMGMTTIKAPNPLAPAFLFATDNHFPVDVTALEDCEVIQVPKEAITHQLATNEAFSRAFLSFTSDRALFLSEQVKLLSMKSVKGKVAMYISRKSDNGAFTLGMSQTALAGHLCVSRQSLSRILSQMTSEGIVSLNGRTGKILNMRRLRQLMVE